MALEVIAQASPHQVVGLLLLPQTVQGQALHRQGLWRETRVERTVRGRTLSCIFPICTSTRLQLTSMLCKLRVGQDLFAELESVSVLLVFVTSLSTKEKRRITLGQENRSDTTEKDRRRRGSGKSHTGVHSLVTTSRLSFTFL